MNYGAITKWMNDVCYEYYSENSGYGKDFRNCGTWLDLNPNGVADIEYFYTLNYHLFFNVMACDL